MLGKDTTIPIYREGIGVDICSEASRAGFPYKSSIVMFDGIVSLVASGLSLCFYQEATDDSAMVDFDVYLMKVALMNFY